MRSNKLIFWLLVTFLLVAFFGFIDATYLAIEHYAGQVPPCTIVHGCAEVTTSAYATIGPVSIALIGAVYYLILIILIIAYFDTRRTVFLRWAALLASGGFVVSVYLTGLQMFVIKAFCLYCLTSAVTSTLLFLIGFWFLQRLKKDPLTPTSSIQ